MQKSKVVTHLFRAEFRKEQTMVCEEEEKNSYVDVIGRNNSENSSRVETLKAILRWRFPEMICEKKRRKNKKQ